jgi:hypothetical protein
VEEMTGKRSEVADSDPTLQTCYRIVLSSQHARHGANSELKNRAVILNSSDSITCLTTSTSLRRYWCKVLCFPPDILFTTEASFAFAYALMIFSNTTDPDSAQVNLFNR